MTIKSSDLSWRIFSLFYWVTCIFFLWFFNGTGIEADSTTHYLIARYAPIHPELYLHHWGKPIFTLLSSPFASFGFLGIKLFNVICAFGASYFSFKIAQNLNLKWPILAPIFYFIFPVSFTTTFSGLTEPLCALALTSTIYLFQHKKFLVSAILISFTPFIRSEGLIFIGVFALFFVNSKNWKALLLISIGHILYSIIGAFYYQDILWVFTKIPYAHLSSHYGSGGLFHFAEKLNYLMGIPLLVLFLLGIVYWLFNKELRSTAVNLTFVTFLAFFVAHSLFWYLEIFNSMGLKRVFAAVTPLMALIALFGFNWITKIKSSKQRTTIAGVMLAIVFIFPFTKNPAAIDWQDLNLTVAQENAMQVADYIKQHKGKIERTIYTDPFLSLALGVDPFREEKHQVLSQNGGAIQPHLKSGDLVIWDNWHAVVDYGVTSEMLSNLKLLKEFNQGNSTYKVYVKE